MSYVANNPESPLIHRSFRIIPHVVKNAKGSYLYLEDGKKILDGCGGAAVVSVGHTNDEVVAEVEKQLESVSYVHSGEYTTEVAEELGKLLLEDYGEIFSKVFLCNSGSEANDGALKLAVQYFYEQGKTSKTAFISRNVSYHGNCIGSLSLSGHIARRKPFKSLLNDAHFHKVSPANEYRFRLEDETTEQYILRLAEEFEETILKVGAKNIAAFVAETVGGASSGCLTAPKGYFSKMKQICDRYDILVILDEVMCGSGRTGTFFAWEQENIIPDIVTCGKSVSSGYGPLSVIFFSEKILNVLQKGSSEFNNGHTYQSYPLSCAAGVAVKKIIKRENLLANVVLMGGYLKDQLTEKLSDSKIVGNIRGRGLFVAVEFVQDKAKKIPFPANEFVGLKIQEAIWEEGVAVYPGHGTVDGILGDHILIAPPFNVTKSEIDDIVNAIQLVVTKFKITYSGDQVIR
ncbi:hypothetical protein BZL39_C06100 [Zygosaccharomyces parabailii]|nr:hypothetical protein BZL39_C06100 [Zygosaccharomyces parabailii]